MKISWNGGSPKIQKLNRSRGLKNYGKVNSDSIKGKDELSISNKAKDFSLVMKALKNVSDVREDKIRDISQKIESGTYNVTGKEIMDKLMSNFEKDNSV